MYGRNLDGFVVAVSATSLFKPLAPVGGIPFVGSGKRSKEGNPSFVPSFEGIRLGRYPPLGAFQPETINECTKVLFLNSRPCSIFVPIPVWALIESIDADSEHPKLWLPDDEPFEPGYLMEMLVKGLDKYLEENTGSEFDKDWDSSIQLLTEFLWAAAHNLSFGDRFLEGEAGLMPTARHTQTCLDRFLDFIGGTAQGETQDPIDTPTDPIDAKKSDASPDSKEKSRGWVGIKEGTESDDSSLTEDDPLLRHPYGTRSSSK